MLLIEFKETIDMKSFSNEQLQTLIAGKIIGDAYPYDTNDEKEIVAHINRLFHRINRIPNVVCEAEWNHFGSGYASFIEFFCYEKEDCVIVDEHHGIQEIETKGLIVDISRLAPVAIMGEDMRYKKVHLETNNLISGAYGSIIDRPDSLRINERFQNTRAELEKALKEFNYELLEAAELNRPLAFQTSIPTIYRNARQYLVIDAIFYWED